MSQILFLNVFLNGYGSIIFLSGPNLISLSNWLGSVAFSFRVHSKVKMDSYLTSIIELSVDSISEIFDNKAEIFDSSFFSFIILFFHFKTLFSHIKISNLLSLPQKFYFTLLKHHSLVLKQNSLFLIMYFLICNLSFQFSKKYFLISKHYFLVLKCLSHKKAQLFVYSIRIFNSMQISVIL